MTFISFASFPLSAWGSQSHLFPFPIVSHWTDKINSVFSPKKDEIRISSAVQCQKKNTSVWWLPLCPLLFPSVTITGEVLRAACSLRRRGYAEGNRDVSRLLNTAHLVFCLGVSKDNDATNAYRLQLHFFSYVLKLNFPAVVQHHSLPRLSESKYACGGVGRSSWLLVLKQTGGKTEGWYSAVADANALYQQHAWSQKRRPPFSHRGIIMRDEGQILPLCNFKWPTYSNLSVILLKEA